MTASVRRGAGSIGLKIAYGENINNQGELLTLTNQVMQVFSATGKPGQWTVDNFPIRKLSVPDGPLKY